MIRVSPIAVGTVSPGLFAAGNQTNAPFDQDVEAGDVQVVGSTRTYALRFTASARPVFIAASRPLDVEEILLRIKYVRNDGNANAAKIAPTTMVIISSNSENPEEVRAFMARSFNKSFVQ